MYKFLRFVLVLLLPALPEAHAQYENVWTFGQGAGLDFNSGVPVPVKSNMFDWGESAASVCDDQGRLLFYTDGTLAWNKNGEVMANGRYLCGIQFTLSTSSTAQGTLILPKPGSPDKYYVFSLTPYEYFQSGRPSMYGSLFYSIVDRKLNNNLGDVVVTEKAVALDSFLYEGMTAVRGEQCNFWLLVYDRIARGFKSYRVDVKGISAKPILSASNISVDTFSASKIEISPDRKKLVMTGINKTTDTGSTVNLYDFDPVTGQVSNGISLAKGHFHYGACFSPDNSKLYVQAPFSLYQYNLNAGNAQQVINSRTFLGGCSKITTLKLGPDGKIYFTSPALPNVTPDSLGTIDQPDQPGLLCGYRARALSLAPATNAQGGLPNVVPQLYLSDTAIQVHDITVCFSNKFELQLDSALYKVHWDNEDTATSREVKQNGTYWVRYIDLNQPCLLQIDTFKVYFPSVPTPLIETTASCFNNNNGSAWVHRATTDTVAYRYVWRNVALDTLSLTDTLSQVPAGSYSLHILTAWCDTTLSFRVPEIKDRVHFSADSLVCVEKALRFTNLSGSHYTRFLWQFGDQDSTDALNPEHHYTRSGTFDVTLTGSGAICRDTLHKTISVDAPAAISFRLSENEICVGTPILVQMRTDDSDTTLSAFHWSIGDTQWTDDTRMQNFQHVFDQEGIYSVALTAKFRACPDQLIRDSVTVYPFPQVYLGADSFICLQNNPLYLKNESGAPLTAYHNIWNTGDTTAILKVVHPGTYSLSVVAGPVGCTTTETVLVRKDCFIDIPNAFSPNDDGVNDYFFPRALLSQGLLSFQMKIFNRWGQLLFETEHTQGQGWDGRFNGKEQPAGVYIYHIELATKNGQGETYHGNLTLLR